MPRALFIKQSVFHSKSKKNRRKSIRRRAFNGRRKNFQTEKNNVFTLSFFLSFFLITCFTFFLYLNLQLVENNFNLREKEKEFNALEGEIKKLEIQVGEVFSIQELKEKSKELNLVKAEDIRHLGTKEAESLSLEDN